MLKNINYFTSIFIQQLGIEIVFIVIRNNYTVIYNAATFREVYVNLKLTVGLKNLKENIKYG